MASYQTSSSEETKQLGKEFAQLLMKSSKTDIEREGAFVIALSGDLGAGKTTFTQGFFEGMGIKKQATSPTFIIMRRHEIAGENGRESSRGTSQHKKIFSNLFHVDAYRIKDNSELDTLGFGDLLEDPQNIFLIEWPKQIKELVPADAVHIVFSYGKNENERTISIK